MEKDVLQVEMAIFEALVTQTVVRGISHRGVETLDPKVVFLLTLVEIDVEQVEIYSFGEPVNDVEIHAQLFSCWIVVVVVWFYAV